MRADKSLTLGAFYLYAVVCIENRCYSERLANSVWNNLNQSSQGGVPRVHGLWRQREAEDGRGSIRYALGSQHAGIDPKISYGET